MAKLITVIRKQPNDPWIAISKNGSSDFSQEDIDTIIRPYQDFVRTLPGIIVDEMSTVVDGDTMTNTLSFDTVEHAQEAKKILFSNDETTPPVVSAKNTIMGKRAVELGVVYSREISIVE